MTRTSDLAYSLVPMSVTEALPLPISACDLEVFLVASNLSRVFVMSIIQ